MRHKRQPCYDLYIMDDFDRDLLRRIVHGVLVKDLRATGRPIIYFDETFLNSTHSSKKLDDMMMSIPFTRGEWLMIVCDGSDDGFTQGWCLTRKPWF